MEYFQKVRSTVSQAVQQVGNVVAGNPVLREFDAIEHNGTAGPVLAWKIYKGSKRSTKQPVSVWVFEKKQVDSWTKDEQTKFVELLKRGVSQLTRVRHPRVLVVEHPLEESRDSLVFCTEPVIGSLANVMGKVETIPDYAAQQCRDYNIQDFEIRCGLKQVAEGLSFLHNDAKMLHRNVCPSSIVINDKGDFKLAGFDFALTGSSTDNGMVSVDSSDIDDHISWKLMPNIDFMAPEYVHGGRCDAYSDMYSLGVVAYSAYNNGNAPLNTKNNLDNLRKNGQLLQSVPQQWCLKLPEDLREDFKLCLNRTPSIRPDAAQFTKIPFFNDPRLGTLHTLESLMQFDNMQKMEIFKKLPDSLTVFEKRPLLQKVKPFLVAEFSNPAMVPFVLPSIFYITGICSQSEFTSSILPDLVPVFRMQKPYQIVLLLLDNMDLILTKTVPSDVQTIVLPLLYSSIGSETTRIQELCLNILPKIGNLISRQNMKVDILPKLLTLAVEGQVLSIRVQALLCLGNLLSTLEEWMVSGQIFPSLPKIPAKDPGILMALLGIYQRISTNFKISHELWARSGLPFLIACSVDTCLNLEQYNQFTTLIRNKMTSVEEEHRLRLHQTSGTSGSSGSAASLPAAPTTVTSKSLAELNSVLSTSSVNPKPQQQQQSASNILSLEEKRRLAAQQEGRHQTVEPTKTTTQTNMAGDWGLTASVKATTSKPMSASSSFAANMSSLDSFDPLSTMSQNKGMKGVQPMSTNNTPTDYRPISSTSVGAGSTSMSNSLGFLPQPPRSSNSAVQRRQDNSMSAFDDLFGPPKAVPTLNSLSGVQSVSSGNSLSSFSLQPTSAPKPTNSQLDPFADLLG